MHGSKTEPVLAVLIYFHNKECRTSNTRNEYVSSYLSPPNTEFRYYLIVFLSMNQEEKVKSSYYPSLLIALHPFRRRPYTHFRWNEKNIHGALFNVKKIMGKEPSYFN